MTSTTQNIAITDSGKKAWKPVGLSAAVKVPGTTTDVVVGDYFQWGAYQNYVTVNGADKGLLIYSSFTNTQCGGTQDNFTFKNSYQFVSSLISPYYKSAYERYTKTSSSEGDGRNSLDISDDVAHTLWGGHLAYAYK